MNYKEDSGLCTKNNDYFALLNIKTLVKAEQNMITIFNRKEVLCAFDMNSQADARGILAANGIRYIIKTNGNDMNDIGTRSMFGRGFGENPRFSCEYRIFVHKNDYEQAKYLLR